jgi:hypothetical protein
MNFMSTPEDLMKTSTQRKRHLDKGLERGLGSLSLLPQTESLQKGTNIRRMRLLFGISKPPDSCSFINLEVRS